VARSAESSSVLRRELEQAIQYGRCAYCRRPGSPDRPLTREHVIPRAKGGKRKDVRIIVPACARCNHRRGCSELVLFLLLRPRRISAFLDYLTTLSPESIREIDLRVIAELYAAVWMLNESVDQGEEWREHLRRLCNGRTLHRRRYAARRMVGAVEGKLDRLRDGDLHRSGPSCLLPLATGASAGPKLDEPMGQLNSRLLSILSLAWQTSAEEVRRLMTMQHEQAVATAALSREEEDGVVRLDGWRRRSRRRRIRVDQRRGRRHSSGRARGRAA